MSAAPPRVSLSFPCDGPFVLICTHLLRNFLGTGKTAQNGIEETWGEVEISEVISFTFDGVENFIESCHPLRASQGQNFLLFA